MTSDTEGDLDISALPIDGRRAHIVPNMNNQSLISIGQLCDAGCKVELNATSAKITHTDNVIFTGTRDQHSKLWSLLPNQPPSLFASSNAAVGSTSTENLVAFSHATLFSPPLTTLEKALKLGFLINFPGLNERSLRKFPPKSEAMVKGHLDQIRKNVRSTKAPPSPSPMPTTTTDTDDPDYFPNDENFEPTDDFFTDIISVPEATGQIYTDQTGRFVSPSSSGNNYIMILYDYDSNAILAKPMKTRTSNCILNAYKFLHAKLVAAGRRPKLQKLDNECSTALKEFLTAENITFQLVPPGVHRRNAAERAIRTFKNHFIAGLCSTDPTFPIHLWDHLLEQAVLTLNLVRGSRVNPKLSAWHQLHGNYDYDAHPMAPPGIKVLVHDKPTTRGTWAPHAVDGWYIGPALCTYRAYKVFINDTQKTRITDTLTWFPTKITMPTPSSDDIIISGINNIINALQNPHPATIAPLATDTTTALHNICDVLHKQQNKNIVPSATTPPETSAPLRVVDTTTAEKPTTPHPSSSVPVPLETTTDADVTPQPLTPSPLRVATQPESLLTYPTLVSHHGRNQRRRANKAARIAQQNSAPSTPISRPQRNIVRPRFNKRTHQREVAANSVTVPPEPSDSRIESAYLGHAVNPDTGNIADYQTLLKSSAGHLWTEGAIDEFGLLLQGNGTTIPNGTDTMRFVPVTDLPPGYKPTYVSFVCAYRPEKTNAYRVRITLGGDRLEYLGNCSTKSADLVTNKIHFNHVISTPNGRFITTDVKAFYLNTPMDEKDWVYARIPINSIPLHIQQLYKLDTLVHNGIVYVQVRKGMYGLKQAGKLANDLLIKNLAPYGYAPVPVTPGLWKHNTRPITFTLVVDDFGICYSNKDDADHLLHALQQHYTISTDWSGSTYCGMHLDWDYNNNTVDISMPGYVERALQRFKHDPPIKPQHSPHRSPPPIYGSRVQLTPEPDITPAVDAKDNKRIQEIIGSLLYYARAVDPTLLVALGTLATQQTAGTQQTMRDITHLLNYCATYPDAIIRYHRSDMILHVESDASYLSETNARSRVGGYYYFSNKYTSTDQLSNESYHPKHNGPIHIISTIMKEVLSSAAEAELAGLFNNGKEICPIRLTLSELGIDQPPTPIQTDNSTACGIANDTVKQRRSKAIDMRFYWIRDCVCQGQYLYIG